MTQIFEFKSSEYTTFQRTEVKDYEKECYSYDYLLAVIITPIIVTSGTFIALYLTGRAVSYVANLAGFSPLPIPSWASKSALIGLPIIHGIAYAVLGRRILGELVVLSRENIGIGYLDPAEYALPRTLCQFFHSGYTQHFYTPAGAEKKELKISKGDLPSHVAVRHKDMSWLQTLLELAKETLTENGMKEYLNHANEKGETIQSLAKSIGIEIELRKILSDLGLSD